ncbi:ABC transporter ATP-binding protein [Pseudohoeflea coraliihabitans]|uniref:ABC transporter ATP-binding protein n=1 Tax=Pseudohoeflea coraliihabitans TaxID=2860393 RepID=A0ABS6WJL1_9HYPH|nr:ABC transporter ATP-binding protein [Pseudohoeflea sp. DP4N28-3]MBW3096133.1 ABC transporter ATP-binding protein [Pseudohoeflea sp. DP4N28-3]
MASIIQVENVSKVYDGGFRALDDVNLSIEEGEILALLGPNGAGKTTLISIICGLVNLTSGSVSVGGHDTIRDYRAARSLIGLVPQEIALEPFQKVLDGLRFTRGLYGKPADPDFLENVLRRLSLWDKRDSMTSELSGGMKRRVLIAKALCHQPKVLFLDEPSAGVDVELRKDMWEVIRQLRAEGVTIILTTHYIEEAEAIADRVGIISKGKILLVEDKDTLVRRMGHREMRIELLEPLASLPDTLAKYSLAQSEDRCTLVYSYEANGERTGIMSLFNDLNAAGIKLRDVDTRQSSLEDIFVSLIEDKPEART